MMFRMARTSVKLLLDESRRDYKYYIKYGWFGSNYYYPTQLNPIKKLAGNFFDFMFTRFYGKKVRTNQVLSDLIGKWQKFRQHENRVTSLLLCYVCLVLSDRLLKWSKKDGFYRTQ
jgi:hypothetical protein